MAVRTLPIKKPEKSRRGPAGGVTGPAGIRLGGNAAVIGATKIDIKNMGVRTLQQIASGKVRTTSAARTRATKELERRGNKGG